MRFLAVFLLTYMLCASFAPALVCIPGTCESEIETACASGCGEEAEVCASSCESSPGCEDTQQPCGAEEETSCPLGACNVCPCCCYCFGYMAEEMNFRITVFESSRTRIVPAGENIRPAFPSDCWQPPEA
jgi:hypothetical protein